MTATKTKQSKFSNQQRFNWGYHDAAQVVREGWNTREKNFGFGPAIKINEAIDVSTYHPDESYAEGWMRGYRDALEGKDTTSSEQAWNDAIVSGDAFEVTPRFHTVG